MSRIASERSPTVGQAEQIHPLGKCMGSSQTAEKDTRALYALIKN